jgi:NADH:ubiquinone oxidoreductase subunit B-like Fe-S oxidoreductase
MESRTEGIWTISGSLVCCTMIMNMKKKSEVDLEALGSEARNPVGARRSWHIGGLMVAAKVLSSSSAFSVSYR